MTVIDEAPVPPAPRLQVALVSEHASPLAALGGVDAGGQNVHVAELAAGLTQAGLDVSVHTRRDDPDLPDRLLTPAGYTVVHVPAGPARRIPKDALWPMMGEFADRLAADFSARPPDLVHAHFWMSGWASARAARALGLPLAITFHALGAVKRRYQGAADTSPPERLAIETELALTADRVIATCSDEVAELRGLGVSAERVSVVPCGVDVDWFGAAAEPLPAGLARHPGRPRLVSVGRLVPRKGIDTVIAALTLLPGVELVVAGGEPAGPGRPDPDRERLRRAAEQQGVADRVRIAGPIPRSVMPALIRSADLVVCAPWYEPFGIVPLEAMACGVPVVGSAVGGLLDSVAPGRTGTLVRPRDPVALADAVADLLADADRRQAYGRAGLERVRHRFTWSRVAEQTAAVYRALSPAGSRPARPAAALAAS